MNHLSKSDFIVASECSKKLIYKKANYQSNKSTNEYLELLAQGGYIIGHMATLYYPDGVHISGSNEACIAQTQELMLNHKVVLFEPAFQSGQKLIRVDILVKNDKEIQLIEVKSKSIDSDAPELNKKKMKVVVDDVTFQYSVFSELYPKYDTRAYLFLPDKTKFSRIADLASWFRLEKGPTMDHNIGSLFNKPVVKFKYENHSDRDRYIDEIRQNGIMSLIDVTMNVKERLNDVAILSTKFVGILNNGINDADYSISKDCKKCEYRMESESDGFAKCWGENAYHDNHIFDLYYGSTITNKNKGFYLNDLISDKKTNISDIDTTMLYKKDNTLGSRGQRQLIQIQNTLDNTEWISPKLTELLSNLEYPLHFIDFETYIGAIPFHQGLRPYDLIAFQWSCHTINQTGEQPTHREWIHTGEGLPDSEAFPNFEFARSLKDVIGGPGTILMWSHHEKSVLNSILNQMNRFEIKDADLEMWLKDFTENFVAKGKLVDMNKVTFDYYFHPAMKGRTSIKKVLPAIWNNFEYLHDIPFFKDYVSKDSDSGFVLDPYDVLMEGISQSELEDDGIDKVNTGTDAMRAYQRIRFDDGLTDEQKDDIRQRLLKYCKLDTMAMVIIAHHWGLK